MTIGAEWDGYAAAFDDEPDHGLRDPCVRAAWSSLLASVLPPGTSSIVDLGCGTGSLAVLVRHVLWAMADPGPLIVSSRS